MAVTETAAATAPRNLAATVTSGRAFGLELEADYDLPALGPSRGHRTRRRTRCETANSAELGAEWPREGWTRDVDLRHPSGRLFLGIQNHPDAGYRISAPRHGHHVVSADGRLVRSALRGRASLSWQRLFFAQALPLAALLQGLEPVHASAVVLEDSAVAFTAASGSGKSSLAAHLVARGAGFLTDDVLALEASPDGAVAHPGPARASVVQHELRSMDAIGRTRLGRRVGRTDKPQFAPTPAAAPVRLGVLYRVHRLTSVGGEVRIREYVPPEPRLVLASCFLPYVQTPARLLNQLATCAAVTSTSRIFELEIPASVTASTAADAVLAHLTRDVLR